MKIKILIFWLLLIHVHSFSQTWSQPVIIYFEEYNDSPDFIIDNLGINHSVWKPMVRLIKAGKPCKPSACFAYLKVKREILLCK